MERVEPLEMLEREITDLACRIHAATCRWLALVAEYDRREGWAQWGCKSCSHWISHQCGIAPGAAITPKCTSPAATAAAAGAPPL